MPQEKPTKLTLPHISPAASKPLYEQIVEGIKREVSAGHLPAHTPLPSFRELAEDLLVSLITTKRAYDELERAGIIYRRQGLGTFVAEGGAERSREVKRDQVDMLLQQAIQEGLEAGMNALRRGASVVSRRDFDAAIRKVLGDEVQGSEEALRMFS